MTEDSSISQRQFPSDPTSMAYSNTYGATTRRAPTWRLSFHLNILLGMALFSLLPVLVEGVGGGGWSPLSRRAPSLQSSSMMSAKQMTNKALKISKKQQDNEEQNTSISSAPDISNCNSLYPRGGDDGPAGNLVGTVGAIVDALSGVVRTVLPPAVAFGRTVTSFYRALPRDVILCQAGLLYCFAGG